MSSKEIILVGVDGSTESFDAVMWAGQRASRTGARVHLVCVYALATYSAAALDGGYMMLDDQALQEGAQAVVDEAGNHLNSIDGIEVTKSIEPGDPPAVLVEMSKDVDLLVVGSRGGSGLADRLLGTVSSALPAHTHCPIVVVPEHKSGKTFTPVERIVVGVDGSDVASAALNKAIDEEAVWNAELTAVSAVPISHGGGFVPWLSTGADRERFNEDVRKGLDSAVDSALDGRDIKVSRYVLDGSPAGLLIEFSTAVDLVIVGTRGRGGFAGVLLGSTSQTVLAHSTCPVMVVPSTKDDRQAYPTTAWKRR